MDEKEYLKFWLLLSVGSHKIRNKKYNNRNMFSSGEQPRLFAPTPSGSTAPDSPNLLKKIKRVTPHTIRFAPSKRIAAVIAVLCTECSELCC
jgi:hypothetical protein